MEKLIVEYSVGDGFTYSATNTVPVLFSSKEEFIVTFEEKLIAQKKQLELFNKRHIELSNQRLEILKKISSFKNSKKSLKEQTQLVEKSQQLHTAIVELHNNHITPLESLHIGGQKFYLDDFFVEKEVFLPQVFTIEEWFANISPIEQ
jgi:hypothetical protein